MLKAHKEIGLKNGLKKENIFVLSNGDNLEITSREAKITDHENIIDEVVLRDNFALNTEKKSNIYNENILSVIIKIKEIQDKNSIDIKLFDKSNNIKIINEVNNFILNHSMNEIFNTDEGWSEITKQFSKNLYKLILDKFNKKYLIKSLFIEK
jgi:mRNA degradation ribonuclease J1/J2